MRHRVVTWVAVLVAAAGVNPSLACSPPRIDSPLQLIEKADGIYRLRVESVAKPLRTDHDRVFPWPDTQIRFRVVGVVKGKPRSVVILPGSITTERDPNDHPAPYTFVRPGGRHGNCYSTSYAKGQEYLVFLKGDTAYWSPLAPTAEEISGQSDAWLAWVVNHLGKTHDSRR